VLIFLFLFCAENKSVIDELDLDEVSNLTKKDSLYASIIQESDNTRKKIEGNIVLLSKFKDLTFKEYLEYKKTFEDTTFFNSIVDRSETIHDNLVDSLLLIYKPKIDSLIVEHKKLYQKINPSSYFRVEFAGIKKEYYSYGDGVKNINIQFKITPLKSPIHGGSFSYEIIPKVTEKAVADAGCRFSTYTSRPSYYYWEAPYDIEKEFKQYTTAEIKNKYDFKYTILSVRYKGKTYKSLDLYDTIPIYMETAIEKDTLSTTDYASIMQSYYNIENASMLNIIFEQIEKEKKKINPTAYEFEKIALKSDSSLK